ncbi:MAG: hypothetical protein STSR0009_17700 [Methanoregula sp.]
MVELIWDERLEENLQKVVSSAPGTESTVREKDCAVRNRSFSSGAEDPYVERSHEGALVV